jgi:hypothetical protein
MRLSPVLPVLHIGRRIVVIGLGVTAAFFGIRGATAQSTASTASATYPAAPTTSVVAHPSGPPQSAAGDLSVYVPPVPPLPVMEHVCEDLVSGRPAEPAGWMPALTGVTGGSVQATTTWCGTFLSLHHLSSAQPGQGRSD